MESFFSFLDIVVCLGAITGFFVFVLLHLVLMRLFGETAIMRLLGIAAGGALLMPMIGVGVLVWIQYGQKPELVGLGIALFLVLCAGMIYWYVLAIIGIATTSLRMQLVSRLAAAGSIGIAPDTLIHPDTINRLVTQRLDRLAAAGHIRLERKSVVLLRPHSFFLWYSRWLEWLRRLYHP